MSKEMLNSDSASLSTWSIISKFDWTSVTPLPYRLITIYDCRVELKWTGKASDGTEVAGKLSIPEVSHEITLDGLSEYVVRPPPSSSFAVLH